MMQETGATIARGCQTGPARTGAAIPILDGREVDAGRSAGEKTCSERNQRCGTARWRRDHRLLVSSPGRRQGA